MQINCKGSIVDLTVPKVMGIVNITPDSFFQHSRVTTENLIKTVGEMLKQGADFIDIGGYSTRPGAGEVSVQEELRRVVPAVEKIVKHFPDVFISVDTFRSEVARQSLDAGACIVNDISAGRLDAAMWEVVSEYQVPYIIMHMEGTPQTMMHNTTYTNIIQQMMYYFSVCKDKAYHYGVNDLIVDVGFCFSKTMDQNYYLLQNLDYFKGLNLPMLVGMSRKSMLYKLLNITPEEALNATQVAHTIAIEKGANIIRVHDVEQAKQAVKMISYMNSFERIKLNSSVFYAKDNTEG